MFIVSKFNGKFASLEDFLDDGNSVNVTRNGCKEYVLELCKIFNIALLSINTSVP